MNPNTHFSGNNEATHPKLTVAKQGVAETHSPLQQPLEFRRSA
jgi:hypothetical protein